MNKNVNFRKAVTILALFLTLAGIHLFIYAQNISLKYQITDLKIKLNELDSTTAALGSRAAREEDLAFIEKTAKGRLGMIYPEDIIYIVKAENPGRK
jgi:cell division protein FtsB